MLMLLLPESGFTNDETKFRSDCGAETIGPFPAGRILSGRYKILGPIDADSFKAHDVLLDQTVTVRRLLLPCESDDDAWRQKVKELASVRDPNFLNVLDLIYDKSGDFVVTEHPRGRSVAELLSEESRFNLDEVLRLVTPLAGALDFAAAFACWPKTISVCWLFAETRRSFAVDSEQRSVCEWPPFCLKLDIWELARAGGIAWSGRTSKTQRSDPKTLAVRQAALLTYELLCGEQVKVSEPQSWFKPLDELSDAANGILNCGLRGLPLFENCECFFHRLESANLSSDEKSTKLRAPYSQTRDYTVALTGTDDVMRRFNRDTRRLATRVLCAVVFAVLVLACMFQERHPQAAGVEDEPGQSRSDRLVNTSPASVSGVVDLNGIGSAGEISSGEPASVYPRLGLILPQEGPSSEAEGGASTQAPVLNLVPEVTAPDVQERTSAWSPIHWRVPLRAIRSNVPKARSRSYVVRPRPDYLKLRLVALWHRIFGHSRRSRGWTAFSNPNRAERKRVGYTIGTIR
jgi:hypothetical protein